MNITSFISFVFVFLPVLFFGNAIKHWDMRHNRRIPHQLLIGEAQKLRILQFCEGLQIQHRILCTLKREGLQILHGTQRF